MKTIQPIIIWNNGINSNAVIFSLNCINDNLKNQAVFNYQLFDINLVQLTEGFLTMSEPDYSTDWFSNDAAYNWAAKELGLIITGNYQSTL
jgi:hypothetical protein